MPVWRSLCNSVMALPRAMPAQALYSWQPALRDAVGRVLDTYPVDLVHVEHLRGAYYGLQIRQLAAARRIQLPIVWDSVDCITHLFRQAAQQSRSWRSRLMTRVELGRTERYEGWLVHQFDGVLVTSATDQATLAALAQESAHTSAATRRIQVLPNGVDLAQFHTADATRAPATVLFSGKMSYHANVTAARYLVEEIMPLVWAVRPDVTVWLVGKDPTPAVRALQRPPSAPTPHAPDAGAVIVTGMVPEVADYLRQATVAVAPILYGAGVQNKVLEALACGAPVVASPQAVSALQTRPGRDLLVAAAPSEFAHHILDIVAQPRLQTQLAQAGRRYVETHHSWDAIGSRLTHVYSRVIAERSSYASAATALA
jgi:glycosyltransferase involved in cell wall biosynthesis